MAQQLDSDLLVDDFYFSAVFDEEEDQIFPVSDDMYAQELQLQEALMSSLTSSQSLTNGVSSSSSMIIHASVAPNSDPIETVKMETGESSKPFCEICVEPKDAEDMFTNVNCSHYFCSDCITKHVMVKIHENFTVISCPGLDCKGLIEIENCGSKLPKEVIDRWSEVQCEALFQEFPKFYCPYKDCSAMLLDYGEVIKESECPVCHRLFCALCRVPWHSGVECEVFEKLNHDERGNDDLIVRELAHSNKWGRCPHCKFYVERTGGCSHMVCRCSFEFCYGCECQWDSSHGGCAKN